jgi:hypothetical protein
METVMEIHQTAFVQAVALAGVVALSMTGWDKGRGETRAHAAGATVGKLAAQGVKKSYVVVAARKGEVQP